MAGWPDGRDGRHGRMAGMAGWPGGPGGPGGRISGLFVKPAMFLTWASGETAGTVARRAPGALLASKSPAPQRPTMITKSKCAPTPKTLRDTTSIRDHERLLAGLVGFCWKLPCSARLRPGRRAVRDGEWVLAAAPTAGGCCAGGRCGDVDGCSDRDGCSDQDKSSDQGGCAGGAGTPVGACPPAGTGAPDRAGAPGRVLRDGVLRLGRAPGWAGATAWAGVSGGRA